MKNKRVHRINIFSVIAITCLAALSCSTGNQRDIASSGYDYPIQPIEFNHVHVEDLFWQPLLDLNREVTIPSGFKKCEETGRIENFKVAGGLKEGEYQGAFPFDDTDVYKIIEGASYALTIQPDPSLEAYIDTIITYIEAAQEPDGYLQTWRTIDPTKPPTSWSGNEGRWSHMGGGHELYNMGHLYEAAVAHYRATGKRSMLEIAIKNAALILESFGPGKIVTPPGHQEIEIGLIKLYRVTGNRDYLDLAKYFLDQRGHESRNGRLFGTGSQDHMPVQQQTEAVGHAVRAGYMYTAMADIAAITKDTAYLMALEAIWDNVVGKKIYLTGGIGARHAGESFGNNYELPNFTAYNETCAAISNIYWNYRMFLLSGNGKYMDVLERTLYNGMLAGVSLTGDHYFYPNPLASDGETTFNMGSCTRSAWFDCSCCPSNVSRFIPSIPGYVYAKNENQLYVNLYMGNSVKMGFQGGSVTLKQKTDYPWDNIIRIELEPDRKRSFDLLLRIPGWAQNQVMASDLYYYTDQKENQITILINGKEAVYSVVDGYAVIHRRWKPGDNVELSLPINARLVRANEKVEENRGKIAVEYGPLVYCAEEADNEADIFNVTTIPEGSAFKSEFRKDLLGGVMTLTANVPVRTESGNGSGEAELLLIPYHRWSNRGPGKMTVWFPALED